MEYRDLQCGNCGKVLCEVDITDGRVRKKCERCDTLNVYEARSPIGIMDLLRLLLATEATKAKSRNVEDSGS
jgi:phage FluMu protein Com